MRKIHFLALSLFLIFATGCLKTVKLKPETTSGWGNVAVASKAASKLNFAYVGTTVFNNSYVAKPLNNEKIDQMIVDDVTEILRERGMNAYAKQNLSPHIYKPKKSKYETDKIDFEAIRSELGVGHSYTHLALLKGGHHAPAAYIGDPIGSSNQSLHGIGLYQRSLLGITDPANFYVVAAIQVYDLRTGDLVTSSQELDFKRTKLKSFPKDEDEIKDEKAILFLEHNYDIIFKAFSQATANLF